MITSHCTDPSRLLVVVDVSIWQMMAWSIATSNSDDAAKSAHKMIGTLCGWLARLLSGTTPAYIVAACDSRGPTWRHAMTSHLLPGDRYKAGRETRPPEYYAECARFERILALHAIPCVRAEGWEADDVAATLTREATARGLSVALYSTDKDWRALVTETVCQWWPASASKEEVIIGRGEVRTSSVLGVEPWQVPHYLALVGDNTDGIKGVSGVGPDKARPALAAWRDVPGILAAPAGDLARMVDEIDALEKERSKLRRKLAKPGAWGIEAKRLCEVSEEIWSLREARDLEKSRALIVANRERVELDLALATLDAWAPIDLDLDAARVGGFDRPALRALYASLGFTGLAGDVSEAA